MRFVETVHGTQINLAYVVKAEPDGPDKVSVTTRNGDAMKVWNWAWEEAKRPGIVGLIPASPGYSVVEMIEGKDGGDVLHKESVVGWAIQDDGQLIPVTATGIDPETRDVLVPDGRVVTAGGWVSGGWKDDAETWLRFRAENIASDN